MRKKFNTNNLILADELDKAEIEDFDIASRILSLSDQLSEEIILTNINDHIDNKIPYASRINYVTSYRNKVEQAIFDPDNMDLKEFIREITERVIVTICNGLKRSYSVTIGRDLSESNDIIKYLEDVETLYEFFFIRNYENVRDLLYQILVTKKDYFVNRYKEIYIEQQEEDVFVSADKKKFKNSDDAIIVNYISDVIEDIKAMYESGYDLFKDIVNMDLYELYNNKMYELLINYGEGIVFSSDTRAAEKYFNILNDKEYFVAIRNEVLLKYLETVEVDETYGNN